MGGRHAGGLGGGLWSELDSRAIVLCVCVLVVVPLSVPRWSLQMNNGAEMFVVRALTARQDTQAIGCSSARCGVPCRFFLSIASSSDLTSSVLPKYFVLNNSAKEGRFLFVRLASLQPRPCPRVPAMALFGGAFACD